MSFGDIRDELGVVDGCICEPAVPGRYSGTMMPDCPVHEDDRKILFEQAFHRVLERHGVALDRLSEM